MYVFCYPILGTCTTIPYNLLCKRSHRLNLGKTRNGELEEKKMLFVRSKSLITVDDIPDNNFVNKVT